jgi:hypothetical protein
MKSQRQVTGDKGQEINKRNSCPVNPLNPVNPVEKKMSDTTEIVTRFSQMERISAFRRLNAAVHTGERGGGLPFRRVNTAVQTGGRSRSDGWTANGEFHRLQTCGTGVSVGIYWIRESGAKKFGAGMFTEGIIVTRISRNLTTDEHR